MAAGDGLISMTPSSIAHSGTSATINSDGGVDFTAVTSLSLNGVFTGDYDNYLVVLRGVVSAGIGIGSRLRVAGSDATATNYTVQQITANGGSVSSTRTTSANNSQLSYFETVQNGLQVHIYGPFLAQPTAFRVVSALDFTNAFIDERANTHSLSTSYDGITIFPTSGNFTGTVHVFGYEE